MIDTRPVGLAAVAQSSDAMPRYCRKGVKSEPEPRRVDGQIAACGRQLGGLLFVIRRSPLE